VIQQSILTYLYNDNDNIIILKDLSNKTLGIIHAALISSRSVEPFIQEIIPEVKVVHHVDDTVQNLNFLQEPGVIPKVNLF